MSSAADPEAAVPTCRIIRSEAALILEVDGPITDILGWTPDDLIGHPSTVFIHPDDQPGAVAAWFDMIAAPGSVRTWRGRYQTKDGGWCWVESVNENHLADLDRPVVVSHIHQVSPEQVGVEEELRARKQLLIRLADALPVGIFQIDGERRVTFTNDRFHAIIGRVVAATTTAQFADLVAPDRDRLSAALSSVLAGDQIDGLEVRLRAIDESDDALRVCEVSMRPLTDHAGTVSGAIGCISDVTVAVGLRSQLEHRATTDALTGCTNRATILEVVEATLHSPTTTSAGVAVLFVDLDDFKMINDRYGHAAGDSLLIEASRRIRGAIRTADHLGRIGGDEFLVLCPNATEVEAHRVAERLRAALHISVTIGEQHSEIRAAVGVAWTACDTTADALIAVADERMYEAKSRQKEQIGA